MTTATEGLLSTENAARYLGISPRTLNNWRCLGGGKGPAFVRVGRAVRYDVRTLDAWITGRTFDSTSAADHEALKAA
jgi:predicted DNA-binding transcriptional regulator AlpA